MYLLYSFFIVKNCKGGPSYYVIGIKFTTPLPPFFFFENVHSTQFNSILFQTMDLFLVVRHVLIVCCQINISYDFLAIT